MPCSGWITDNATTSAVKAATSHREAPASAAKAIAPAGVRRLSNQGPATKNTTTSAATDSDQSRLIVCGEMPAALQRMTENVSCRAWLPRMSAATRTTSRNSRRRSSSRMP